MYQQEGIMKLDLVLHTPQTQHNDQIQQNTAATKCPNQLLAETKINKYWKSLIIPLPQRFLNHKKKENRARD